MSHSTLEITILSVENLQMNKKSTKKNAFVSVQSDSSNDICSTKMDDSGRSTGSCCLSWNDEKLVVDVPLGARFITAEVKCKASRGVKSIGMARIAVSDLDLKENQVQFLSYRLWDSNVRRNCVNYQYLSEGKSAGMFFSGDWNAGGR
ncbi:C2 domain [Sesbania bispinosa]|nr:C2 domain [Sesbania bispinosa]